MPFSSNSGKTFCDRTVQRLTRVLSNSFTHKKVVDLGAGSGTYFHRYGNTNLNTFEWTAVEVWKPYIEQYNLRTLYSKVVESDVRTFFDTSENYDICFLGDLAEHMKKEEAQKLVLNALTKCEVIIMSIPIIHYPQGEYEGNPYEEHIKDDWSTKEVLESFDNIVSYGVENEIGVFVISKRQDIIEALKPQIAVYAICKNEKAFIERMYESIKQADVIVVTDTCSTDGTYELLLEKQKSHSNMIVNKALVSPWRFDDARNISLCMIPEDIDLCISIDADEFMETSNWYQILSNVISNDLQTLGKSKDRYNHRFSTLWNWNKPNEEVSKSEHWHERIHGRKGFQWKLPVHEVLVKNGPEVVGWLENVMMTQWPDTTKSRGSYLDLLKISLQEDPKRWKTYSFYAGEIANVSIDEAINVLETAKTLEDADKTYLNYQQSEFYKMQGKFPEAINSLMQSTMIAPHVREYKVYLAELLKLANKQKMAEIMILEAEQVLNRTFGYEFNSRCWNESFEQIKTSIMKV